MYELERQAQEDPLLMDLIMGMESGEPQEHERVLLEIDDLIDQRTRPEKSCILPLIRWSIAASILIVSGLAALFVIKDKSPGRISAGNQKERSSKVDSVLKPANPDPAKVMDEKVDIATNSRKRKPAPEKPRDNLVTVSRAEPEIAMLEVPEKKDPGQLNEVVIIGYGTQKKSSVTGAVATIKAEELAPQIALQGRVPGVAVDELKSKTFKIRGSSSLKTNLQGDGKQVTGTVRDKTTNQTLPGVFVKVKGTDIATVTDLNGQFKLAVPDSNQTLQLAYIGFDSASIKVNKNDSIVIAMNPSSSSLNEVVVVGYGSKRDDDPADNQNREVAPVHGWQEYNKYIKKNAIVSKGQKGTVVLSFSVSSNGSLSDFKIVKTDSPNLNVKAISLVVDGPAWHGPKAGTQKVRLRIKFKEVED